MPTRTVSGGLRARRRCSAAAGVLEDLLLGALEGDLVEAGHRLRTRGRRQAQVVA